MEAEERERFVRLAAAHRRPRHLVLVEAGKDAVPEEDRAPLGELRTALNAGELGQEGFMTSLRLGGRDGRGAQEDHLRAAARRRLTEPGR